MSTLKDYDLPARILSKIVRRGALKHFIIARVANAGERSMKVEDRLEASERLA